MKVFRNSSLYGNDVLENLAKFGFVKDDNRCFSHAPSLDHCGGVIEWNDDKTGYRPAF